MERLESHRSMSRLPKKEVERKIIEFNEALYVARCIKEAIENGSTGWRVIEAPYDSKRGRYLHFADKEVVSLMNWGIFGMYRELVDEGKGKVANKILSNFRKRTHGNILSLNFNSQSFF